MVELDKVNLLLFGGFDLDHTLNDLWLFNRETNMWTEIKNLMETLDNIWPWAIKDFSMIKYSNVKKFFILKGNNFIWRRTLCFK